MSDKSTGPRRKGLEIVHGRTDDRYMDATSTAPDHAEVLRTARTVRASQMLKSRAADREFMRTMGMDRFGRPL